MDIRKTGWLFWSRAGSLLRGNLRYVSKASHEFFIVQNRASWNMKSLVVAVAFVVLGIAAVPRHAEAQQFNPRIGLGVNGMVSTADGIGIGFRSRVSAPINADVSLALDAGFTGFILGGRRDASYVFDPQFSVIVNLPQQGDQLSYLLFGAGAYVPLGESSSSSGPTIHFGYGRVRVLQETSLFYEIDPAIIIAENRVDLVIPVRIGIIF